MKDEHIGNIAVCIIMMIVIGMCGWWHNVQSDECRRKGGQYIVTRYQSLCVKRGEAFIPLD